MCIYVPANGSEPYRRRVNLINITDSRGLVRHFPDAREFWGELALPTAQAVLVKWKRNERPLSNGTYLAFSGSAYGGLPLNQWFSSCRWGLYGDTIVLKIFGEEMRRMYPEYPIDR